MLASVGASRVDAAPRSVTFAYRYPSSGNCAGVALYYSASRAEIESGANLTRVDLGLLPTGSDSLVRAVVPGFDDSQDYFAVLRCYDGNGNESRNSGVGVIPAAPPQTPAGSELYHEDFESYPPAADPAQWLDSAPNLASPGDAALFETAELDDGSLVYGAASGMDLNSTVDASGAGSWSFYEFTGRIEADQLRGYRGVTVLSRYPETQFYYRLSHFANLPYTLVKRGGTDGLTCAGSQSTGVTPLPGQWLTFRVRVTRFDARNRIRASMWPDGGAAASGWQVDCWDTQPEPVASGRVGVFSGGDGGSHWDDLTVASVGFDGAPPAYVPDTTPPPTTPPPTTPPPTTPPPTTPPPTTPPPTTPPPTTPPPVTPPPVTPPPNSPPSAYSSAGQLAHWWRPGWDTSALGKDFAPGGGADASLLTEVQASDIANPGTPNAEVDLDGKTESLANPTLRSYGVADSWSLAAWVRPAFTPSGKRVILDLNGADSTTGVSRIILFVDESGRFSITVSDSAGRLRTIAAPSAFNVASTTAWYHVVAVKSGTSLLSLYVNGALAMSTNVGVPAQTDAQRLLRIGGRVRDSANYYWKGGIAGLALWRSPLSAAEVTALYASRASDLRPR